MLAAGVVPATVRAANCAWRWTLLGCAMAAVYYIILWFLTEDARPIGEKCGSSVLLLALLWTVLAAGRAFSGAVDAFPEGREAILCTPILAALCVLGAWKGSETGGRCAGVLAPMLGLLLAVLILCAVGGVDAELLQNRDSPTDAFGIFAAMLLPSAGLYLPCREEKRTFPLFPVLAILVIPTAICVICSGNLGAATIAEEAVPLYTLGKSIRIGAYIPRMEPLISVLLYTAYFCAGLLLTCSAGEIAGQLLSLRTPVAAIAVGLAAYGAGLVTQAVPVAAFDIGAAVFWGIVPLLTQFTDGVKKVGKKQK